MSKKSENPTNPTNPTKPAKAETHVEFQHKLAMQNRVPSTKGDAVR